MKRFFLVIVLAILTMAAIAQEPYKAYCEIVGTGNITGTKVKIEVDFGQKAKWAKNEAKTHKKRTFSRKILV